MFSSCLLSSKWTTKTQLYNLLKRESKICLPLKQDATQSFLRDLIMERKNYIKLEDVNGIKVPQYKDLTVRDIINLAHQNIHIDRFLPNYDYLKDSYREWQSNVVSTIVSEKINNLLNLKQKREASD